MNHHLRCPAKAILLTILAVCMTFVLSSCGGKEVKESQMKADVLELLSTSDFSVYNLDVTSFSVSKRQTNAEDKTDYVWCTAAATGNAAHNTEAKFSCSIDCELTYVLYNDGWRLEDTWKLTLPSSSVKPLVYPTEEKVKEYADQGQFGWRAWKIEVHDMIEDSDTQVVYPVDRYVARINGVPDNSAEPERIEITYNFNHKKNGWTVSGWETTY